MILHNVYEEKEINKKIILRMGNVIGLAFLVGNIFNELVLQIISCFYYVTGENIFANDGIAWAYQIIMSTVIFILPFSAATPFLNVRLGAVCDLSKPRKGTFLPTIFMGLGFMMFANFLSGILNNFFTKIGLSNETYLSSDASNGFLIPFIALIAGSVLPAFIEEFSLRGVVFGTLRRYGASFAIISSAVLFGIMHKNIFQIPFAFLVGLFLGFATYKTGSMWTAIAIHLVNNFFAHLLEVVSQLVGEEFFIFVNYAYMAVALFLGFVGLLMATKLGDYFKIPTENKKTELSLSEKLKAFFASPGIVIYIIYIVYKIITTHFSAFAYIVSLIHG